MHNHKQNRRVRRAVPALLAALALALSLAGCGAQQPQEQMPDFDPEALTEAQTYAAAALETCDLPEGHEITDVKVMLTDDIVADLSKDVTLAEWDEVLDTRAIVIATATGEYTPAPPEDTEEETALIDEEADTAEAADEEDTEAADEAAAEATPEDAETAEAADEAAAEATPEDAETADEAADEAGEPEAVVVTYPLIFLLDENKHVNYFLSGLESAAVPDDSGEFTASALEEKTQELAEAEAVAEQYLADHQVIARQAAQLEEKIDKNADFLWTEEGVAYVKGNSILTNYVVLLRQADVLRWEVDALKGAASADQERAIQAKAESDGAIRTERVRLYDELLDVVSEKNTLRGENSSELSHLIQTIDELESENPEYYYQEDYLRECVANRACSSYDICLREEVIYNNAIDTADQALATDDLGRRDYLMALDAAKSELFADYSDALKAHASSMADYETFQKDQADALAAMNESFAAVKEEQGENYETSADYLKLRVKYKNLLDKQENYETAISDAEAAVEEILARGEAAIQAIEDAETQRLHDLAVAQEQTALDAWLLGEAATTETRSEYEAEPGQWGVLHPDFVAWINSLEPAEAADGEDADETEDADAEEASEETAAPVSGSDKDQTKPAGDKDDKVPAAQSDKTGDKDDKTPAAQDNKTDDKDDKTPASQSGKTDDKEDKPSADDAEEPAASDKTDKDNKNDKTDKTDKDDTAAAPADSEPPADNAGPGTYGGGDSGGLRDAAGGSDHIGEYLDSRLAA